MPDNRSPSQPLNCESGSLRTSKKHRSLSTPDAPSTRPAESLQSNFVACFYPCFPARNCQYGGDCTSQTLCFPFTDLPSHIFFNISLPIPLSYLSAQTSCALSPFPPRCESCTLLLPQSTVAFDSVFLDRSLGLDLLFSHFFLKSSTANLFLWRGQVEPKQRKSVAFSEGAVIMDTNGEVTEAPQVEKPTTENDGRFS